MLACAACAGIRANSEEARAPRTFYTVTAEIALARHEPRVAALQYAAAAANETAPELLKHATEVAAESLQPSLTAGIAARWINADPQSADAQRDAARAALALHKINEAAAHYRIVLLTSPLGIDAEFEALATELAEDENIFGARQLADRLSGFFPASAAALRLQGFAALRADDPAAAVRSFTAASALSAPEGKESDDAEHQQLLQTLARARIMAGDAEEPLSRAQERLERDATPANRLDYALMLMTAQRDAQAIEQLDILTHHSESAPLALRLLGLIEFQQGRLDSAALRFAELLTKGKYLDDAFYYLALIADRQNEPERALRLYAQVRSGENALPALLRATAILNAHGAAPAAEELLDRLTEDQPQRAPQILAARARMYADAGDLPRGLEVLEQAIGEYPDNVDLRYARASTYEELGKVDAALRELTDLVKQRPDDPAALNALGFTLADHALELARARKLIETAHAAAPKNAAILDSLGWVLFRQGHADEALTYLEAAYADDRGGDIGAHLGEVLWQLGKQSDAKRIWFEALSVDADNRLLKSTLQRFHAAN